MRDDPRVSIDGGWVDPQAGYANVDGEQRVLSERELDLLRHLLAHAGETRSREALLEAVWGGGDDASRVVDVTVRRLRQKIERDPALPATLMTVHSEGYCLRLRDEPLPPASPVAGVFSLGSGTLDVVGRTWRTSEVTCSLSHEEARLLGALAEADGAPVARRDLQVAVWGHGRHAALQEVDYLVHQVRKKVEPDPTVPRWVRAHPGRGYWLDRPGARSSDPTWTNLTAGRTLVGRSREREALQHLLDTSRLAFVVGTAGVGKSHLARHVALAAQDVGEAWFCDLAGATSQADVQGAVAATLGVQVGSIGHALAGRGPILLVLDEADDGIEAASEQARAWVAQVPGLRVIVTSREHPRGVLPLELGTLPADDAMELLVDRVRELDPDWDPEARRPHLRRLVASLDGLPLAVELAAARVRVTDDAPSTAGADLLSDSIRRSWDRLGPAARDAFTQLAVFPASFSLAAVEGVVQVGAPPLPLLDELHQHSLVQDSDLPGRFQLYAPVRAFAAARLDDAGATRARHTAWFTERAGAWFLAAKSRRAPGALERLRIEAPNLQAAGTPECILALAHGDRGNMSSSGRLDQAIATAQGSDLRARLLVERALRSFHAGDMAAARLDLDRACAIEDLSPGVTDQCRLTWALVCYRAGRWKEATDWLEQVEGHEDENAAERWGVRGLVAAGRGHHEEAERAHIRSAAAYDALGMGSDRARQLFNLAVVRVLTGRPARALGTLELAVQTHRRVGSHYLVVHGLSVLGSALVEVGDLTRAEATLREALTLARRLGSRPLEATVTGNLGNALRGRGLAEEALELHRAARQLHLDAGRLAASHLALLNIAADAITAERLDVALETLSEALVQGADTPRIVVASHCLLAVIHGLRGDALAAEDSVQQALALAPGGGVTRDEGRSLAETVAGFVDLARARTGDEAALDRVQRALSGPVPAGFQMVRWAREVLASAASKTARNADSL